MSASRKNEYTCDAGSLTSSVIEQVGGKIDNEYEKQGHDTAGIPPERQKIPASAQKCIEEGAQCNEKSIYRRNNRWPGDLQGSNRHERPKKKAPAYIGSSPGILC
jgi:hypothetical protein